MASGAVVEGENGSEVEIALVVVVVLGNELWEEAKTDYGVEENDCEVVSDF